MGDGAAQVCLIRLVIPKRSVKDSEPRFTVATELINPTGRTVAAPSRPLIFVSHGEVVLQDCLDL
jgi:hypothetical protein